MLYQNVGIPAVKRFPLRPGREVVTTSLLTAHPGDRTRGGAAGRVKCQILRTASQAGDIADEWRDLHQRAGGNPFTDYDMVQLWWQTIGSSTRGNTLHIVIARRYGRLVAVLPLVVRRTYGVRILRGVGTNTERFCDLLDDDEEAVAAVWQAVRYSQYYDFAILRGVFANFVSHVILARFARERDSLQEYHLRLQWPNSDGWMASLRAKVRTNIKRGVKLMTEHGPISYEVYEAGPVPVDIIEAMIKEKQRWCIANRRDSWVLEPGALQYLLTACTAAAAKKQLFLAWLKCGDQFVSFEQGYIFGGTIYGEFRTYNEGWAQQSPGHVMLASSVRWAIDNGYELLNLGPGNTDKSADGENHFKTKYANDMVNGSEFTFSRTLQGKLLEFGYVKARSEWRKRNTPQADLTLPMFWPT